MPPCDNGASTRSPKKQDKGRGPMSTAIHKRTRPDRQSARMTPMFRLLFAAIVALTFWQGFARAEEEIQGIALVKVEDPKKGTIPDMVYGYGTISPSSGSSSTFS